MTVQTGEKKAPQRQPGKESAMSPKPKAVDFHYLGSGKLMSKVAIITGGDSGIGRATAYAFSLEGADVVVAYLSEHKDAQETRAFIERHGGRCLLVAGDIG